MELFFTRAKTKLKDWALKHTKGAYANRWLAFLSFLESSVFPIPADVFLIAIILRNKARGWIRHTTITTVFSVIGGVFGYAIGALFFDAFGEHLIALYNLQDEFLALQTQFANHTFLAIFTAAFTPIPYKVFTITAGLFTVNLFLFILASILGRGIRFFIVGYILKLYGEQIAGVVYRYVNWASIIVITLLILWYIFV